MIWGTIRKRDEVEIKSGGLYPQQEGHWLRLDQLLKGEQPLHQPHLLHPRPARAS